MHACLLKLPILEIHQHAFSTSLISSTIHSKLIQPKNVTYQLNQKTTSYCQSTPQLPKLAKRTTLGRKWYQCSLLGLLKAKSVHFWSTVDCANEVNKSFRRSHQWKARWQSKVLYNQLKPKSFKLKKSEARLPLGNETSKTTSRLPHLKFVGIDPRKSRMIK